MSIFSSVLFDFVVFSSTSWWFSGLHSSPTLHLEKVREVKRCTWRESLEGLQKVSWKVGGGSGAYYSFTMFCYRLLLFYNLLLRFITCESCFTIFFTTSRQRRQSRQRGQSRQRRAERRERQEKVGKRQERVGKGQDKRRKKARGKVRHITGEDFDSRFSCLLDCDSTLGTCVFSIFYYVLLLLYYVLLLFTTFY